MFEKLFSIKEEGIYLIINIFGIKITLKPERLRAKEIQRKFNNYYNTNASINNSLEKGLYELFLREKDNMDYSVIGNIPYVSIIITVYNIGKDYLIKCLDSVINQTLKNIEIIIVNDNSPMKEDDDICKEYANKDSRIRYIFNDENKGPGGSRLEGLKYATGYTIAFVDSDDYIKLETYEIALFYMFFYKVDIITFGIINIKNNMISENIILNSVFYNDDVIKAFIDYNPYIKGNLWNKLFKNTLLSDDFIPINIKNGEDRVAVFNIFKIAKSLAVINLPLYYYNLREGSITTQINKNYIYESLLSCILMIENNNNIDINFNILYSFYINHIYRELYEKLKFKNRELFNELTIYLKDLILEHLLKYSQLEFVEIYELLNSLNTIQYESLIWYRKEIYNTLLELNKDKFRTSYIDNNTVLVTELNDVHGEVIPGIVKYFLDLSYKVDILVTFKQLASGVLNIFKNNENVRIFCFYRESLINIIKNENLSSYKCIFITSYYLYYVSSNWPSVKDYIKNIDKKNKNMIIMEHHLDLVNEKYIKNNQIVVMHNLDKNKFPIYINPHYFGDVKITSKNDNITKFIIVGWIESHRKNFDLLFNGFNKLLQNGFTNFKLIIVGKGNITSDIGLLYQYIDVKGRLNYPDMYKEIEEADFFIPLLDNENPEHYRYLKYGVSGSFQLIYGFRKPCILHTKFSETYGINNNNSILYDKNEYFFEAIKKAVNMNNDEYSNMQHNLGLYADDLYRKSLENLKYIIENNN